MEILCRGSSCEELFEAILEVRGDGQDQRADGMGLTKTSHGHLNHSLGLVDRKVALLPSVLASEKDGLAVAPGAKANRRILISTSSPPWRITFHRPLPRHIVASPSGRLNTDLTPHAICPRYCDLPIHSPGATPSSQSHHIPPNAPSPAQRDHVLIGA